MGVPTDRARCHRGFCPEFQLSVDEGIDPFFIIEDEYEIRGIHADLEPETTPSNVNVHRRAPLAVGHSHGHQPVAPPSTDTKCCLNNFWNHGDSLSAFQKF